MKSVGIAPALIRSPGVISMFTDIPGLVAFPIGLILLLLGAELLVRGAARAAAALRVAPLMIGLTVVAFGTSTPELTVSVLATARGVDDVALGNVVGSNIFNVLVILGLSALITPLAIHLRLLRFELWVALLAAGAVWVMGLDGRIGRFEGAALLAALVAYTLITIRMARRIPDSKPQYTKIQQSARQWAFNTAEILGGLAFLVVGGQALVTSSVKLATAAGVSDLLIGLTIVAAGTSLPELATSAVAAWRGQRDIAVGNVIGSNIFNIFGVLGASALSGSGGVAVASGALRLDIPMMVGVALICVPVFLSGRRVDRVEGGVLLGAYCVYVAALFHAG